MNDYIKFVNQEKPNCNVSHYDGGVVVTAGDNYIIGYAQKGAEDTYSIGQPVYDSEDNLMGYMGIVLFETLNYSSDKNVRIPVECWAILLPTEHCKKGKKVKGYWQNVEMRGE